MRPLIACTLACALAALPACAGDPPPAPAPGVTAAAPAAALPAAAAPAALPAESDAVRPALLPAPLPLAGGGTLVEQEGVALLRRGDAEDYMVVGRLHAPPAVAPGGGRLAVSVERDQGARGALVLWEHTVVGWTPRTLIKGPQLVDRITFDPAGGRIAFVWAGEQGGVAGIYVMSVADGVPVRVTNKEPSAPGQPPADWQPLPLRAAPTFDGATLRWTSEAGAHEAALPTES